MRMLAFLEGVLLVALALVSGASAKSLEEPDGWRLAGSEGSTFDLGLTLVVVLAICTVAVLIGIVIRGRAEEQWNHHVRGIRDLAAAQAQTLREHLTANQRAAGQRTTWSADVTRFVLRTLARVAERFDRGPQGRTMEPPPTYAANLMVFTTTPAESTMRLASHLDEVDRLGWLELRSSLSSKATARAAGVDPNVKPIALEVPLRQRRHLALPGAPRAYWSHAPVVEEGRRAFGRWNLRRHPRDGRQKIVAELGRYFGDDGKNVTSWASYRLDDETHVVLNIHADARGVLRHDPEAFFREAFPLLALVRELCRLMPGATGLDPAKHQR